MRIDPAFTAYPIPGFTEPVSALSHLIGAGVFAGVGLWLTACAQRDQRFWLVLFTVTAVFLLSMSGVYHLLDYGTVAREEVFRRLDHAAIFVLIAGTSSAAHGLLFRGFWRWGMIALLWLSVVVAVVLTVVFFHAIPPLLSLSLYLAFGWLGALSGYEIWRTADFRLVSPLLTGGVAYTVGAVAQFSAERLWVPGVFGAHAFFHLAVLMGLGLHCVFFWRIIQPPARVRRTASTPVAGQQDITI